MKYKSSIILSTTLFIIFSGQNSQASFFDADPSGDDVRKAQHRRQKHANKLRDQRLAQEKADAEMARKLDQEEADAEMAQKLAQEIADAEMAWRLYTQRLDTTIRYTDDERPEMPGYVLLSYETYDEAIRFRVTRDMSVHAFNAVTGLRRRLPLLLEADTFSKPNKSFAETRAAIESSPFYDDFERQGALGKNMNALGVHLALNPVEASETDTNVEEIFSQVWSLAMNHPDYARQVFVALCDNTETGGGCYPGHAGRLGRLYVNLLRDQWQE